MFPDLHDAQRTAVAPIHMFIDCPFCIYVRMYAKFNAFYLAAQAELEAHLEANDLYATRRILYIQNLKPSYLDARAE